MQVNSGYKDILNMAYPVMIGSLATTLLNITDTAFLGRIGEAELGASAIGGILYFVLVMIGISIGTGAQILIARRAGENNHRAVGSIFDQSFVIIAFLSVILFLLLKFILVALLPLMITDKAVLQATFEFMEYRSYGLFFLMASTIFRSFFVGIAQPKIFGIYSFLMAGLNIVLGFGLIFGHLGMPALGIKGAGLASSISEALALVFLVAWTATRPDIKKFHLFRFTFSEKGLTGKIIGLSLPLVVQNLLSMGAWFVFFLFIEKLGAHELAISNVVRGAYMLGMTPFWGFSSAANSMVSNLIGQGRQDEVVPLVQRILLVSLAFATLVVLFNILLANPILTIFSNDAGLIQDSKASFMVVTGCVYFFSTAIILISAVSGTGSTRMALNIEIAAILLYMIYIYWMTFIQRSSVEVLWLSELIYWFFTGIASYLYLRHPKWKSIQV